MVKAKPDKSLKHFADVRHEPDVYEGGALQTSPEIDFDLDDWDSHQEVRDWGFKEDKKYRKKMAKMEKKGLGIKSKYHEFGPDGEPVAQE